MSKDRVIKDIIRAAGPKNVIIITVQDFRELVKEAAELVVARLYPYAGVDSKKLSLDELKKIASSQLKKVESPKVVEVKKDETGKTEKLSN
jgi:hypothetical protein